MKLSLRVILLLIALPISAASWKAEGPYFGNTLSIIVDHANPDRLWVSTHGGGVWRSVDGGKSWKLSGKLLADRVVSFVAQQPKSNVLWAGAEQGALARSKDGGDTWEWVRTDLAYTPHRPTFDPTNPKAMWLADVNLHKRTTDGGVKWTEFRVSGGDVMTFTFHPKDAKTIYAGGVNGRAGLWKTIDAGGSWKQIGRGLNEMNRARRLLIDPNNPDTMYMAAWRGVYKSTDAGETWTALSGNFHDQEIESLTMHPTSPETIFVSTKKGFMKSTDGGATWNRMGGGYPNYVTRSLAIHPITPDIMWAAAAGAGIYKTTDGGKTWTEANNGFAASWIENVWGGPSGQMFARTSRGVFRADGQGGWTEITQPFSDDEANIFSVIFDVKNPRLVHAGDPGDLNRSTDGGATWTELVKPFQDPSPAFHNVVFDEKNPKIIYSADRHTSSDDPPIFKSVDGGAKWKPAHKGISVGMRILELRLDTSGALVALANEGAGFWRSTDGAMSWTTGGSGLPAKDVKAMAIDPTNPKLMFVAAKEGLFRSEDAGATFTKVATKLEDEELESVAVDARGIFYVANGDGVHRSSDQGKTWTPFNDGLTNPDVRILHSAGARLYAGTAGGGVFSIVLE